MMDFSLNTAELVWPFTIALAWLIGEFGYRWTRLPRISIYGLVGFCMVNLSFNWLPHGSSDTLLLLANIAFGLVLFEFGYRINLHWLRINPWIGLTGLLEAGGTFAAVYYVTQWFGTSMMVSLLLAALAMATSPAGVLRVINEQRSLGQVTERALHLTAINCVLAVFAFKVISAFWVFQTSGNLWQAINASFVILLESVVLGVIFGILLPLILRRLGNLAQDGTVAFAIAVILLVALAHAANLSSILAALTFGLMARRRRVALSRTQRNFGALGNLLTVLLFVYVASTLQWQRVMDGAILGLLLVAVRLVVKVTATTLLAPFSGISLRKGVLTGFALAPLSVFVVLTLEQTSYFDANLSQQLAALTAMTLLLDIIGPLVTKLALILARETPQEA